MVSKQIHSAVDVRTAVTAEIAAYEAEIGQFRAGALDAAVFKARRAARGVYEQREDGKFMVRARVPGGLLPAHQARAAADICADLGGGFVHVTTRQDIQFHDVTLDGTVEVMRRLLRVGISTLGSGGNTVRNIVACPFAGVCPAEEFDIGPHVLALNGVVTAAAGAFKLPRKFKVAFNGCGCDCALASIADLGFVAKVRDGVAGYAVYAGGGLGFHCRLAERVEDWVPATELATVTQAFLRLFERLGDHGNRARARLRFVFERLGVEAVKAEYAAEKGAHPVPLAVPASEILSPVAAGPDGRPLWRREQVMSGLRVVPQRQAERVAIALHPPLGLIAAPDLRVLAAAAEEFSGEKCLCLTPAQGVLLRQVARARLPDAAVALKALSGALRDSGALGQITPCTGAAICRLGVCNARDTAQAVAAALATAGISPDALEQASVRISGCGNACSQAPVADIGLTGGGRRVDGVLRHEYKILLGARRGADVTRFGECLATLSAAAAPAALVHLLRDFQAHRLPAEGYADYVARRGTAHCKDALASASAPAEKGCTSA